MNAVLKEPLPEPLTVVCWKWKPHAGYHTTFNSDSVNVLKRMVARHYPYPHIFTCITDDPKGIDKDVRIIPLWDDLANVPNPHGPRGPSCYRRLKSFSKEAAEIIGPRFVSLDLDCVITGDLSPLWDRPEDFVIWGDTAKGTPYNGSMFLLRAGTRTKAWERFNPITSPRLSRAKRYIGSDQGWLGVCLGPNEKKWSASDGVYSYRNQIAPKGGKLPANARIVLFHGRLNPWDREIQQKHEWVRRFYQ